MNAPLKNTLFAAPNHQSNKDVIHWWEQRRLFYNAVMLAAGFITIMLAVVLGEIPFFDLINALPPILIVALSANLFYTLGWMLEITCRKFITDKAPVQKVRPVLYFAGISISVFFTLAIDIAIIIAFFFGNPHP